MFTSLDFYCLPIHFDLKTLTDVVVSSILSSIAIYTTAIAKKKVIADWICYIILIAKTKTPVIPVILNLFTDEIKRMNLLFYVTWFVFSFHFIHIFPYNLLRIVLLLRSFPLIQFIYSGLARSFTISNCMVRSIRMTKMIRKTKTGKLISIRLYGWIIFNAMCFDYSSLDWFHFYFLIISVIMCDWKWNS